MFFNCWDERGGDEHCVSCVGVGEPDLFSSDVFVTFKLRSCVPVLDADVRSASLNIPEIPSDLVPNFIFHLQPSPENREEPSGRFQRGGSCHVVNPLFSLCQREALCQHFPYFITLLLPPPKSGCVGHSLLEYFLLSIVWLKYD